MNVKGFLNLKGLVSLMSHLSLFLAIVVRMKVIMMGVGTLAIRTSATPFFVTSAKVFL